MSKKKSQITLYILIGLIILLFSFIIIFYRSDNLNNKSIDSLTESLKTSFNGKTGAENLVKSCVEKIVNEGVTIMRLQGGFIDIPANYKTLTINSKYNIIERNGSKKISYGQGKIRVPIYYTKDYFRYPTKELLEKELENYINKELPLCVNNFQAIEDVYKLKLKEDSVTSKVEINKSLLVSGSFLITGSKNKIEWKIDKFSYAFQINFLKYIKYAQGLLFYEAYDNYLENFVRKIISLYGYGGLKDEYTLPPFSFTDIRLDFNKATWILPEVKQNLAELLSANIHYLKFNATRFKMPVFNDPLAERTFKMFIMNYFSKDNRTEINLFYSPEWDYDLIINPSVGNYIIKPVSIKLTMPVLPIFNIIKYRYKYTTVIPFLYKIRDFDSYSIYLPYSKYYYNGTDFYFGVDAYLCGNNPRNCFYNTTNITYPIYQPEESAEEVFCKDIVQENFIVNVIDKQSNNPVNNAEVHFVCGDYDCLLGYTGRRGNAVVDLPYCINGELYAFNQNHSKSYTFITTSRTSKVPGKKVLKLNRIKKLNISVKLINAYQLLKDIYETNVFNNPNCNGENYKVLLDKHSCKISQNDRLLITIEGKNLLSQTIVYPNMNELSLAPGRYSFSYNYLQNTTIHPGFLNNQQVNLSENGSKTDLFPMGATKFTFNFDSSIYQGNNIILYVPVEFCPGQYLTLNLYLDSIIENEGDLSHTIKGDKNCDGTEEQVDHFSIYKNQYELALNPIVK